MSRAFSDDKESTAQHLLLFVSALIPKAVASLLTSAIIELSKPENVRLYVQLKYTRGFVFVLQRRWQELVQGEAAAEEVILEVERLWPPFFGGSRVCTEVGVCVCEDIAWLPSSLWRKGNRC